MSLRAVLALVGVLFLASILATSAISSGEGNDDGPLSMDELGGRLAATWQVDLRDAQRKQDLDGRIRVVRVDCAPEPDMHFTCLGHVAANREARRLVPVNATFTGRLGKHGGWAATFPEQQP